MDKFHFSAQELLSHPEILEQKGITELELYDEEICSNKVKLLKFIHNLQNLHISTYITFNIKPNLVDKETLNAFMEIPCCLQFEFLPSYTESERKFFSRKIALLNEAGLVFGFELDAVNFASMKAFRSSIDDSISYYPNHIYVETENLKPTDKLSTQDIKNIRRLSFALETFYSCGRAVPWFLAVTESLRLKSAVFLGDFAEWQECNNCGISSGFNPESAKHTEIEKMQLNFLRIKYEEKRASHVFPAAQDLICMHGAFSRSDSDGSETVLELSYHPEDILSPYAMDLLSFADEVCMEMCTVKVFSGENGPDFIIL